MTLEFQKPYAGSLKYVPRLELTPDVIERLRQKLIEKGIVLEAENPQVVIDWYQVERDANHRPVWQNSVVLLRDGGDAEKPGCIFYRKELDHSKSTTKEFYHIPAAEHQEALANAWRWWEDTTEQKLEILNQYIDQITASIDDWHSL
jgi:hypothetical protein